MSWRFLTFFIVFCMTGSALAGMVLGNWLVNEAPIVEEGSRTNMLLTSEQVLDASGRPLAGIPPQPLSDGTLGMPQKIIPPMWEIQAVSLFDSNLDPMVSLAIGNQSFTISDVLNQAGAGLEFDESGVSTIDVTQNDAPGTGTANDAMNSGWKQALDDAVRACDSVNFFSRPGCIDRAQRQYCEPNKAWGKYRNCPSQQPSIGSGA